MPADVECPATPPELPLDPTPERMKLSPGREAGSGDGSPGRASPDSACPICLGKLDNKAFSDGCMHQFCFTCIVEWSKVRAVCPLCKQGFTSIIHNVRSELDYDRYRLPPPPPTTDPQHPYIYRPGHGPESRSRWLQMRRQQYRYRSLVLPMLWPVPEGHDYHLPTAPARPRPPPRSRLTSESRRHLYGSDMWARPTADELTGRYRETGPDFYRNNPAVTHRLVPWLNRELNAVLDSPTHLAHVMEHIMELITRLHILSPEFRAHLQPYMSPWTEHFVHELYCYARSPYDMVGYDLHVQYQSGRPASPPTQLMASSTESDSGSDSDIRVLTPPPRPRTPVLVEPPSPEPGPSGVCAALGRVRAFLATARAAESSSDSDSDSPVEVVEVVPPRHERPPVVVTLSSDDEPPPPPPPAVALDLRLPRTDSDRHRAARLERRAALAAGDAKRPRRGDAGHKEAKHRSGGRPGKNHRQDKSGGDAATVSRSQKHRSSRTLKSHDREADAEVQRSERTDECASKSSERSAKSKSSESSSKSKSSERSSKSKPSERSSKSKSSKGSSKSKSSERTSERSCEPKSSEMTDERSYKSSESSHKSKSSERSSKSKSSKGSSKSKSSDRTSERSCEPKSSDMTDERSSKSSEISHKSKSSERSSKSKSSEKSSMRHKHASKKRHKKYVKDDDIRSRHHKRSRLDSDSSPTPGYCPASPEPSTSAGVARPRLFQRIVLPSSSPSEPASSSSSVTGVPARGARCRRLSESSSVSGESVGPRRPAVRSAVVFARRAASSDGSGSSDCTGW